MLKEAYLFGKDHPDPQEYFVDAISDDVGIGIASVVPKEHKSHNWANNEDAVGFYEGDRVRIMMTADAHWGYVASQEAVLQFPGIFNENLKDGKDIRQSYLESCLKLCEDLAGVGQRSGVSHGKNFMGQDVRDDSVSQFHSVVNIGREYYFVGMGDCLTHVISQEGNKRIKTIGRNQSFVGSHLNPRQYMRPSDYDAGLDRDAEIRFDDPLVRKGVDVVQLSVRKGDLIFMSTDGYNPSVLSRDHFSGRTISETLDEILSGTLERGGHDNIAIGAMRVD